MDDGSKLAILMGGGLAAWGLGSWLYRKLFDGPEPEDPTGSEEEVEDSPGEESEN